MIRRRPAIAKIWAPSAQKVKRLSTDLTTYIEGLKENLISKSNPQMKDGKREFTDGNLDAATRLFDTEKAGGVLYEKLKKYRVDLLELVDPSHYPDVSPSDKARPAKQKAEFCPPSAPGYTYP